MPWFNRSFEPSLFKEEKPQYKSKLLSLGFSDRSNFLSYILQVCKQFHRHYKHFHVLHLSSGVDVPLDDFGFSCMEF